MAMRGPTGTVATRWLGITAVVLSVWTAWFGLFVSPDDVNQGSSVRIMYVHVPTVWVAYVAFVLTALCSGVYLSGKGRSLAWDRIAGASAEVGVLFVAVCLVTGSLWGRLTWGVYWVWDARLTTTAFLFVTYVGYLAVRRLGGSEHRRARRSAVVGLLAVLQIPLVHFSVRLWDTLHQEASVAGRGDVELDGLMLFTLFLGMIAFTVVYVWLLLHRQRALALEDAHAGRDLEEAIRERRAEAGDNLAGKGATI
jgi:heme exporter protein C